jgi:hypothetical protein
VESEIGYGQNSLPSTIVTLILALKIKGRERGKGERKGREERERERGKEGREGREDGRS